MIGKLVQTEKNKLIVSIRQKSIIFQGFNTKLYLSIRVRAHLSLFYLLSIYRKLCLFRKC